MPDASSRSVLLVAAALSSLVGAGTAWVVLRNAPPPGGPVIEHRGPASLDTEKELAALREKVNALQADLADARLNLAAARALPRLNPAIQAGSALSEPDPSMLEGLTDGERAKFTDLLARMRARAAAAAEEAQAYFEEQELRTRLRRDPATSGIDPGKVERLVGVLREGAERVKALRGDPEAPGGEAELRTRIEAVGRETRARLQEFLTPAEVEALDAVLSPPPPGGQGGR
ncbi:MAG: hypothetical protein L6R43_18710 [Planctomycetes bacterium]|nr:hypothetical protein [Planctomycetota bacterium]